LADIFTWNKIKKKKKVFLLICRREKRKNHWAPSALLRFRNELRARAARRTRSLEEKAEGSTRVTCDDDSGLLSHRPENLEIQRERQLFSLFSLSFLSRFSFLLSFPPRSQEMSPSLFSLSKMKRDAARQPY
jgi:hypothetical protein